MLKTIAIGISALTTAVFAQDEEHNQYSRTLKFQPDGTFKIVTFSDLEMNNNSEDYLQTQALIESVLNIEDPDLIVLTGDVVDVKEADEYAYHFSSALELIKARQVPWVWTGGNKVDGITRRQLHEIDYSQGLNLSWSGYVWDMHLTTPVGKVYDQENLGYFTSRIPIMDPSGQQEVFSIYTIDTGAEYCLNQGLPGESCITTDAIDWLTEQMHTYSHKHTLRDFIFLHKPIPEFMNLANLYTISGHKEQAIGCQAINSGLFATALDTKKAVWINAGNDADNDFSGRYHNDMMFSYSRKTGYGGKGNLPRGVRSFLLTKEAHSAMHGSSYIIEGDTGLQSTDMHKRDPPTFGFSRQTQCSVDPFAEIFDTIFDPEFGQQ